ncbi:MAG: hypothetical protein HOP33_11790 [Verrucomicrobia bacterium]|nr:hypothetical protein [Verrucomicrobiota bacterium]
MKTNYISALVANAALTAAILLATATASAQTFTTLKNFSSADGGIGINSGLTLSGGMLYGVGGSPANFPAGMIYKVSTNGSGFTVIHQFTGGSEGSFPAGRVVISGNTIYGVTYQGGTNFNLNNQFGGDGIIYRVSTDGSDFSVLRRLDATAGDGYKPEFGMVLSGSTLYGTTLQGGDFDRGAVFKISTNGTGYQNIHSFDYATDGTQPQAELTLIGNTLFGTTAFGNFAAPNGGELFKIGLDGTGFSVLYTFTNLFSVQIEAMNGLTAVGNTLYGVGLDYATSKSSVYRINTNGSGFQIISQLPSGSWFCGVLTWTGSELLGTWSDELETGVIFQVKTNGTGYRVLETFGSADGSGTAIDLVLAGTVLYGTARPSQLGVHTNSTGTVFSFDVRPRLAIAAAGASAKVSWPSYAYNYQLEQSPTLASASWTNVLGAPLDDGTNQSTTFSPGPGNWLFRLHKP